MTDITAVDLLPPASPPTISTKATRSGPGSPPPITNASASSTRCRSPLLLHRRHRHRHRAARAASRRTALCSATTYNRLFTLHGIVMVWFFLVPSIPTTLGNFLLPLMIGASDVAFPAAQSFSWYLFIAGAAVHRLCADRRRRRYRLDLLHAVLDAVLQQPCDCGRGRRVHRRLFVDRHRRQFHRHHAHAARAGHDLVPAAAVRVGDLCDQHRDGAGDAGAGDVAAAGDRRALPSACRSSIRR